LAGLEDCSDEGGHGVVELEERLHVDGEAGAAVVGHRVQHQPGQRVIALQDVPAQDRSAGGGQEG